MADVKVDAKRAEDEICPYCQDSLVGELWKCEGCSTWLHLECVKELGRCSTIGCAARVDVTSLQARKRGPELTVSERDASPKVSVSPVVRETNRTVSEQNQSNPGCATRHKVVGWAMFLYMMVGPFAIVIYLGPYRTNELAGHIFAYSVLGLSLLGLWLLVDLQLTADKERRERKERERRSEASQSGAD